MLKYLAADSNTDSRLFSEVIRPGAPLIKQAAAVDPEIQKCISGLKSTPGKIYILANALGAGEYYGSNMNGDFFEEKELNPPDGSTEYGYKTFLQSGVYRHHSNKDITKSYGTILCAAYNKAMHRVELVIEIDKKKCEDVGHADLWKRLEAGEKPAVSMGSKVPYDVCIICGNKSRTKDDYCFPPGTAITMADGSRKAIENIAVGDLVLSAEGLPTHVVALLPSHVDECLTVLKTSAHGIPVRLTGNHPVLSSPREAFSCYYRTTQPGSRSCFPGTRAECVTCRRPSVAPDFVAAQDLRKDDTLYMPAVLSAHAENAPVLPLEDAYVVGLFMAEGCFAKQDGVRSSVQFAFHRDELEMIDAVQRFAQRHAGRTAKVYPSGPNGVSVRIHAKEVADHLFSLCGEYAHAKVASTLLVNQPDAVLREYLRGLWDGDGHISTKKAGYSRLNSASENLVWQTAGLLRRLGFTSYVGRTVTPGGPTKRSNTFTQWYVQTNYGTGVHRTESSMEGTRQLAQVVRTHEEHYCGPVYNFETEDHTYVAEGLAVHNCTHAKEQLNQLLPDGRKVYVLNPRPKFFDISVVIIGADRVSYVMDKVAQARMPAILSSYLAVEEGLRDPLESITAKLKLATHGKSAELVKRLKATAAQVVTPGAKDEIDLPNGVLDGLARSGSLSKILTTTAASGIVLKPQEFQRIVLLLSNKPDMADRLSHGCGCFSPSAQIDRSISFGDSSSFSGGLADLLAPFLRDRSAFEPVVSRRILVIKTAQARRPLTYVREPLLDKIAAAYNGYRAELLEKIGSIVANITERDVHLLAEVRKELFEGMFSGRSLAIKTASAPVPLALLGAIPLAYFYGAHTGGSTEQDKAADSFIAKHPVLAISVLAGLARLAVKAESSGAAEKVVSKLLNR